MQLNDMYHTCKSEYPYCVDGNCGKLSSHPWHNEVCSFSARLTELLLSSLDTVRA
jgi:hypothetical protein